MLIEESHPTSKEVRKVYDAVCNLAQLAVGSEMDSPVPVRIGPIARLTGFSEGKINTAVTLLARQDTWRVLPQRGNAGLIHYRQTVSAFREYAEGYANAPLTEFVHTLLRTVDAGAFSDWREVDIRILARRTGLSLEHLLKGMEYLQGHQLLDWILRIR